jgi:hypothetical protein
MGDDQVELVERPAEHVGGTGRHVVVRRAVEAVPADAELGVPGLGHGVPVGGRGSVRWKAVSNTATWGTSGHVAGPASMPAGSPGCGAGRAAPGRGRPRPPVVDAGPARRTRRRRAPRGARSPRRVGRASSTSIRDLERRLVVVDLLDDAAGEPFAPVSESTSWYLTEELPELSTSTRIGVSLRSGRRPPGRR